MQKIIRASLLTLALSSFTYAGNMPTPAPEPEPNSQITTQETEGGHIPNGQSVESAVTTMQEAVLGLLQGVLSLF